jgi:CheY-like chemotaxis protein
MASGANDASAKRILVVEDEYLVAVDLAEALEDGGFHVIGPAADLESAQRLATEEPVIHAALLDVNLRGEFVWPVAAILEQRAVPTILTTGYNASEIPSSHAHLARHQKPVAIRALVQHLQEMIGKGSSQP